MNSLEVTFPQTNSHLREQNMPLPLGPAPGTPLLPKGKWMEHSIKSMLMAERMVFYRNPWTFMALGQLQKNGLLNVEKF